MGICHECSAVINDGAEKNCSECGASQETAVEGFDPVTTNSIRCLECDAMWDQFSDFCPECGAERTGHTEQDSTGRRMSFVSSISFPTSKPARDTMVEVDLDELPETSRLKRTFTNLADEELRNSP